MKKNFKLFVVVATLIFAVFTGCSNPSVNIPSQYLSNDMLKPVKVVKNPIVNTHLYSVTMTLTPCEYGIRITVVPNKSSFFDENGVYIEDQFGNQIEFKNLYDDFGNITEYDYRKVLGKIDFVYPFVSVGNKYTFTLYADYQPLKDCTLTVENYLNIIEKADVTNFALDGYILQDAKNINYGEVDISFDKIAIPVDGRNTKLVDWNIIYLFSNNFNTNWDWTNAMGLKVPYPNNYPSDCWIGNIISINLNTNTLQGNVKIDTVSNYSYVSRNIQAKFTPKGDKLPKFVKVGGEVLHLSDVQYIRTNTTNNINIVKS